jgi:hypothetical protein
MVGGKAKAASVNGRCGSNGMIGMASRNGVVGGLDAKFPSPRATPATLTDPTASPAFRALRRLTLCNISVSERACLFTSHLFLKQRKRLQVNISGHAVRQGVTEIAVTTYFG